MTPSETCYALIKLSESLRLTPYLDATGNATVGYGHKLLNGETMQPITEEEANYLLDQDTASAGEAVGALVTVPLSQGQFDALTDFCYNEGRSQLRNSTLLRLLNQGNYDAVPEQLYREDEDGRQGGWIYAGGKILPGLVTRRKREIAIWHGNPDWQSVS